MSLDREDEFVAHYTDEYGRVVFTRTYLLNRGYCCENGCRHCPYGFQKNGAAPEAGLPSPDASPQQPQKF